MARDQNAAGKYPSIAKPMQTSTSVGVVQAIGHLLSVRPRERPFPERVDIRIRMFVITNYAMEISRSLAEARAMNK
jgi:hypothetical protein